MAQTSLLTTRWMRKEKTKVEILQSLGNRRSYLCFGTEYRKGREDVKGNVHLGAVVHEKNSGKKHSSNDGNANPPEQAVTAYF